MQIGGTAGRVGALLLVGVACARIEPPPGGPPDKLPPSLIATRPDSLTSLAGFDGAVEFTFDEVISEGGQPSMGLGTSDLEKLILLSPSENVPRVSWKRNVIAVEPKEGWKPNRVYRIELLPGITDLQRNRLDSGAVVTFTTGAPLPTVTLSGRVVDWPAGRLARSALIEAVLAPDSLRYRAFTDSSGDYSFGPLPPGEYVVYGVIDQARNLRRDIRDHFDSTRIQADSSLAVAVLWAVPHDTIGPRLQTVSTMDSMTVDLAFNQLLDPYQQFEPGQVRILLLPDSVPVAVRSLLPRTVDDSLQRAARAALDTVRPADSSRAALDSARRAADDSVKDQRPGVPSDADRAMLASRPALFDHLVGRINTPFIPGRQYLVLVSGIRNVNKVAAAESRLALSIPERAPPPPPADSTPPSPPDSVRPDSTRPTPRP